MAIVKPIKVCVGNLAGLRGIVDYIQDPTKTKNGALVYGQDVFPEKTATQMIIRIRCTVPQIVRRNVTQ